MACCIGAKRPDSEPHIPVCTFSQSALLFALSLFLSLAHSLPASPFFHGTDGFPRSLVSSWFPLLSPMHPFLCLSGARPHLARSILHWQLHRTTHVILLLAHILWYTNNCDINWPVYAIWGRHASISRSWQSNKGTTCASGIAGIEPMPSACDIILR